MPAYKSLISQVWLYVQRHDGIHMDINKISSECIFKSLQYEFHNVKMIAAVWKCFLDAQEKALTFIKHFAAWLNSEHRILSILILRSVHWHPVRYENQPNIWRQQLVWRQQLPAASILPDYPGMLHEGLAKISKHPQVESNCYKLYLGCANQIYDAKGVSSWTQIPLLTQLTGIYVY